MQHLVTSKEVSCLRFLEKRENYFHLLASCIAISVWSWSITCFKLKFCWNFISCPCYQLSTFAIHDAAVTGGSLCQGGSAPQNHHVGSKTGCLLEEQRGMLHEIGISGEILSTTLRTKATKLKIRKVDYIKTKGFGTSEGPINSVESSIILE